MNSIINYEFKTRNGTVTCDGDIQIINHKNN